jgi:ABC-2 type transport system ATP-binding protein
MIPRRLLALVGLLLLLLTAAPAPAALAATNVIETGLRLAAVPEPDGSKVTLDVSVFTTDPAAPKPAIVLAHGFGGSKEENATPARDLARHGYAVITYTARGFGASGGRIHLDDPRYEGADTKALIDLAASRPEVEKTGSDPVIGFAGVSYGGAATLLAAGLDRRVDAIVPEFTWHSLTSVLLPQYVVSAPQVSLADVTPTDPVGVFKQQWAALFFSGGGNPDESGDVSAGLCGRFDPALCSAYVRTAESGRPTPAILALLAHSDMGGIVSKITAPTLLIGGEQDTLFPLDQADANLRGLPPTTPAKMVWDAGGHDAGISIESLLPQMESWFDRYLTRNGSPPDTSFSLAVSQTSLVDENDANRGPDTYTAPAYPGRGAPLTTSVLPLTGASQQIVSPPGGTPASLTSAPGAGSALGSVSGLGGYSLAVLPGQSATFTSVPLSSPRLLVGSGRVRLQVTSSGQDATLFAGLWDLGPNVTSTPSPDGRTESSPGTAVLPGLGVAPVHLTGLRPGIPTQVEVALPTISHQVAVGHRVQLVVASTDQAYAVPTRTAAYAVALAGPVALTLPKLDATRVNAGRLDVPLPLILTVSALVLGAVATGVAVWLRRRSDHSREDLRDTPLVVENLVKTYAGDIKAVDDVSFTARPGQVVGLLGPNGAGKTTVLRILVGLISPDSGSVYVTGEPVHAGADVLGTVGAFIEGPGFLPHLTGMENLRAYWAATGRPEEEAHVDEALAIAGLGTAIDRRVRGYSQGMRQRLGIAQAMLGRPDLLLLDEPTNGLDPPQIKAMRTVLQGYAATGRTVVVSSHLLAEVQQTCTDVVVMHHGRVILTGSMADLTASDDVTLIGLAPGADVTQARATLEVLGASTSVEEKLIKVTGAVPRSQLVAGLVDAGVAIDSVDGHRQLEEVFLTLVGPVEGPSTGSGYVSRSEPVEDRPSTGSGDGAARGSGDGAARGSGYGPSAGSGASP